MQPSGELGCSSSGGSSKQRVLTAESASSPLSFMILCLFRGLSCFLGLLSSCAWRFTALITSSHPLLTSWLLTSNQVRYFLTQSIGVSVLYAFYILLSCTFPYFPISSPSQFPFKLGSKFRVAAEQWRGTCQILLTINCIITANAFATAKCTWPSCPVCLCRHMYVLSQVCIVILCTYVSQDNSWEAKYN